MIAGAGGQFLASPTDLVKVRLQVEGKRVLEGHPPRSVTHPKTNKGEAGEGSATHLAPDERRGLLQVSV